MGVAGHCLPTHTWFSTLSAHKIALKEMSLSQILLFCTSYLTSYFNVNVLQISWFHRNNNCWTASPWVFMLVISQSIILLIHLMYSLPHVSWPLTHLAFNHIYEVVYFCLFSHPLTFFLFIIVILSINNSIPMNTSQIPFEKLGQRSCLSVINQDG